MHHQYKQLILIILFMILVVSCTSVPSQTTILPTSTATVKPNFTSTPSVTKAPYQTRTPKADIDELEESTSPDGVWTATITRTIRGNNYNLYFALKNNQNNQIWVVENLDFTEPENPLEGYKYPYVFKWSDDGKYLHYSHLSTGGDACTIMLKPAGYDFIRFDLISGDTVTIRDGWTQWLALSPDEKHLAYVEDKGITLLYMETGKEQNFPLPAMEVEHGLERRTYYSEWAPDGKSLIYTHLLGFCDTTVYTYIIQINLATQQQTILVDHDEHAYIPIEWNIQEKIVLKDNGDNLWWLNPNTKEIIPAQP